MIRLACGLGHAPLEWASPAKARILAAQLGQLKQKYRFPGKRASGAQGAEERHLRFDQPANVGTGSQLTATDRPVKRLHVSCWASHNGSLKKPGHWQPAIQ